MLRPKKIICVFTVTCQKNLGSVGRDSFFFYSGISFSKFPVKWRILQFFYLLCSQFRQKASSWINKTLLLVKQQKWLCEFIGMLAKIRVGRVTVNTHFFFCLTIKDSIVTVICRTAINTLFFYINLCLAKFDSL